jgi:hypothetical protein
MATGSEQHVVVVIMVAAPPKVGTAARSAHPFGETPHIAANPHAWRILRHWCCHIVWCRDAVPTAVTERAQAALPAREPAHGAPPHLCLSLGMDSDVWKSELSVFVSAKNVNMDIRIRIRF